MRKIELSSTTNSRALLLSLIFTAANNTSCRQAPQEPVSHVQPLASSAKPTITPEQIVASSAAITECVITNPPEMTQEGNVISGIVVRGYHLPQTISYYIIQAEQVVYTNNSSVEAGGFVVIRIPEQRLSHQGYELLVSIPNNPETIEQCIHSTSDQRRSSRTPAPQTI